MRLGIAVCVGLVGTLAAQDFVDLPWRVSGTGVLEVQSIGATGNKEPRLVEWTPMFPGLFARGPSGEEPGFGMAPSLGLIAAMPLLLHGDGGGAAIEESTRRLRKLGIRVSLMRSEMAGVEPDPLVDLLRVRYVSQSDLLSATYVLIDYATDERRDRFVRAAAASAALLQCTDAKKRDWIAETVGPGRVTRNGVAALHSGLERLPDDADLVFGLHSAQLPSAAELLGAWRELYARVMSQTALEYGATLSSSQFVFPQRCMDMPGQLPHELAARFGNWRVDYALVALCWADGERWWLHLGGRFLPNLIAEGLKKTGADVTLRGGVLAAEGYGWNLRVTKTTFEAWQGDLAAMPRGRRMAALRDRAAAGQAPAWMLVRPGSRMSGRLGLSGASLQVQVDPESKLATAIAVCPDEQAAATIHKEWNAWQKGAEFDRNQPIDDNDPVTWGDVESAPIGSNEREKGRLTWRQIVQRIAIRTEGRKVEWRSDFSRVPVLDLLRWLTPPVADRLRFR